MDKNIIEIIKTTKELFENLYKSYSGNDGEMVMIDELDCYIYKGKKFHCYGQNFIVYGSDDGIIKIDGTEESGSIVDLSYIEVSEDKKIKFYELNKNPEELQFLNDVIEKINNKLNSNNKHR